LVSGGGRFASRVFVAATDGAARFAVFSDGDGTASSVTADCAAGLEFRVDFLLLTPYLDDLAL
jgi:hypothetical protein